MVDPFYEFFSLYAYGLAAIVVFAVTAPVHAGIAALIRRFGQLGHSEEGWRLPWWVGPTAGAVPVVACNVVWVWPLLARLSIWRPWGSVDRMSEAAFIWGHYLPYLLAIVSVVVSLVLSGTWLIRHRHGWLVGVLVLIDIASLCWILLVSLFLVA